MYSQQPYFMNQMAPAQWPCQGEQMPFMYQQHVAGEMNQGQVKQQEGGKNFSNDLSELPMEQSYIENILRLNRGKIATVYMSFNGSSNPYEPTVFRGIVEAAGRDHIVLSDPETGERYLLLMVFLNYVKFDEEIEYSYPLAEMDTYSPR